MIVKFPVRRVDTVWNALPVRRSTHRSYRVGFLPYASHS